MALKRKVVLVELLGATRQEGILTMMLWLRDHRYDFVTLITNGADARAQAATLQKNGPFYAIVTDVHQFPSFEHALTTFSLIAEILLPESDIVEYRGTDGQPEEDITNTFLGLYLR